VWSEYTIDVERIKKFIVQTLNDLKRKKLKFVCKIEQFDCETVEGIGVSEN
jgi:hypothetical protein